MNASPRLKLTGYFLLVLLTGIGLGAAGALRYFKRTMERRQDPAHWAGDTMERFDARLRFTPEQKRQLAPILDRMTSDLQAVRQRAWSDWLDAIRLVAKEARPILSPEQTIEFDRLVEEFRQRIAASPRLQAGK